MNRAPLPAACPIFEMVAAAAITPPNSLDDEQPVTSALQTYLDLNYQGGRGEDAASAIFEKHLGRKLKAVVTRERDRSNGGV